MRQKKPERLHQGWSAYLHSYLTYQALNEPSITSPLGRIRRAAEALCVQDDDTRSELVTTYIKSLVLLAASVDGLSLFQTPATELDNCSGSDPRLEADIHVAAIYLGRKDYVERVIAEGVQFCNTLKDVRSTVFGEAFAAAASHGDLGMIKLLLLCDDGYKNDGVVKRDTQRRILGIATVYGHRAAFDFALDTRPFLLPEEAQRRGNADAFIIEYAVRVARRPDHYERLAAILGPNSKRFDPKRDGCPTAWLTRSVNSGREQMVRYFLDNGAILNHPRAHRDSSPGLYLYKPLLPAVRRGHETITKVLLDAGADPNWYSFDDTPLMEAVWRGSVTLVKLLLERNAEVNEGFPAPIVMAVFKENLDIFHLLRERGARLDTPETGGWAMALARLHGLDSMVDLLIREGVGKDVVLHRVGSEMEVKWSYYRFWPMRSRNYVGRQNGHWV